MAAGSGNLKRKLGKNLKPASANISDPVGLKRRRRCIRVGQIPQKEVNRVYECIYGTIYGQCSGDALGLLTEALTKEEAEKHYGPVCERLEYVCKRMVPDRHREQWKTGDWTDETDLMILLLKCLVDNMGKILPCKFAKMLMEWTEEGFRELGDKTGSGICPYMKSVIEHPQFSEQPQKAAEIMWRNCGDYMATNSVLAFVPVLGIHYYSALGKVIKNTMEVCSMTHADSRCQAASVAVSVTIALLIQQDKKHLKKSGSYDIEAIVSDSFAYASKLLNSPAEVRELKKFLFITSLKQLSLDEPGKTRYIYKTLGAGMWALRQKTFRETIQEIVMEGGDADANAGVAGALLGCKLRVGAIPVPWLKNLLHRFWLDAILDRYLNMLEGGGKPKTKYETGV